MIGHGDAGSATVLAARSKSVIAGDNPAACTRELRL
jgi:hypothetical protein